MKKILSTLIIAGLFCVFTFSQTVPKFTLSKDGVKPVVLTLDASYTANQIYTKVKSWNANMVNYQSSTIRIDKENVQVKHGGYIDKAWNIRANNYDHWYEMTYTLNIEIKEGRCRVTFENTADSYKVWFNADGTVIKKFKDAKSTFEATINNLLTSLYNHIKSTPKKVEDNW